MFIDLLQNIDERITLAINSLNSGLTDQFMCMMSSTTLWIPMYVIVTALIVRQVGWKKAAVIVTSILLTFAFCDQLSNLVKNSVARLRPCYNQFMINGGLHILERRGSHFGFFSAHAANAFGFVTTLMIGLRASDRKRKFRGAAWIGALWASLVSISRIFVGKHFLGDVLAGAAIGIVSGCIIGLLAARFISKHEERKKAVVATAQQLLSPSERSATPLRERSSLSKDYL